MNNKKIIIGLAGKAGSGKDTAAVGLVDSKGFAQYAFAWPLKRAVGVMFGFSEDQLYGSLREVVDPFWGSTPRSVLQRFGTEAMRGTFGDDFWLCVARNWIEPHPRVVISDVRFDNEADWIRNQGGLVIHLFRDAQSSLSTEAQAHASERGVSICAQDVIVANDSGIDILRKRVIAAVEDRFNV